MNNKPGSVVVLDYADLNGTICKGIFLVIYDEATDNLTQLGGNIIALKITTSINQISPYYMALNLEKDTFFDRQCYVVCNRPNTFNKSQIRACMGMIQKRELLKVYRLFQKYNANVEQQILDSLLSINKMKGE